MSSADIILQAPGLLTEPKVPLPVFEKSELIEATAWGKAFSFEQIKKMARYMDVYKVARKTVLFAEGEKRVYLVLIARGHVDVIKFDSNHTPKKITTLGPGKTIGEMSLIDGEPRSASAVAATEATLLVMTAAHFEALNKALPGIGLILALKIAKQMSQYLRLTSGRLIDHLGE
ncbi:MAG: cyclic nucleotide-binding domain-containing protein [Desulfosarcina sp.]|nr:cyclic nucleotide-binding domain-containing protein [Desulfobacterales bacterium]